MLNFENFLQQLLQSPPITKLSLKQQTPRQQGAYILWFDNVPPVCLKIGIAGPRKGKGLLARLKNHFSGNPKVSVLARHMAADMTSLWWKGYNFQDRDQRQRFLIEKCYFQVISLPQLNRKELEMFEDFIEDKLKPRYAGRVNK